MSDNVKNTQQYPKLKVIWYFLKQHLLLAFVLLSNSLLIGGLGMLNVALVYTILNWGLGVQDAQGNMFTRFNEFIISYIPIDDKFIAACVFFLAVSTLFCIFMYTEIIIRATLITRIITRARLAIFRKFVNADYQYFLDHKQGDLIYRAGEAPEHLISLYFSIMTIISDAVLLLSLLCVVFVITPKGAVVLVSLGVAYHVFTQYIGYRHLYLCGQQIKASRQDYNVILNESITGIRSIKVNGFYNSLMSKIATAIDRHYYHYKKAQLWQNFPQVLLRMMFYLCLGVVSIVIRMRHPDSFVTILPVFGALAFAILNLLPKLTSLGMQKMRIFQALPHVEIVYATLNVKNQTIIGGSKEFRTLKNAIEFKNVHFSHKARVELLKGTYVSFEKGKMTAIVGKSGSGKSTIVHLLLRLFAPEAGKIMVDGQDLEEFDTSSWLSKIGFVDQDVFIYNATINENIVFGLENYSESDIVNAAKIANAHEFISNLPQGYDTVVGDRGVKLSGGEQQRVAIARAVLRNPQIIILDEATASLDNVSEALVQKAINNILKGHTVIVIAHRLSTIQNADKIIVIDEGSVAEEGKHEELLAKKGTYWTLYNMQKVNEEAGSRVSAMMDTADIQTVN